MTMQIFKIISINISTKKGEKKSPVKNAVIQKGFGIAGDAHAGFAHRQVSLLAMESIEKMRAKGLKVGPGDFAENITTMGIDLCALSIGAKLKLGDAVQMEITQIGKECLKPCAIFKQAGDCVMPREGLFARVVCGGNISVGDLGRLC